MPSRPQDEGSLQLDDLHEESSIESELHSCEECLEVDDSDLDSTTAGTSLGKPNNWETESTESPLLSKAENDEFDNLSDTLNDEEGDESDLRKMGRVGEGLSYISTLFSSFSDLPLTKITEHTRETSTSCHTNSIRADLDSPSRRLSSPSGRWSNRFSRVSPLKSPRSICRQGVDARNLSGPGQTKLTLFEWDEGMLDGGKLSTLSLDDPKLDEELDPAE